MVTFLKDLTQIILGHMSDFYSLCGFHFVFILVAAEEKAGESSSSKQAFGIKTDDSGARYVTEIQTG